jgi:hypothetical protein
VDELLEWAERENVIIRTDSGEEFLLASLDDFEHEVESLKHNDDFIAFLDARAQEPMVSLEEARKRLLD